MLSVRLLRTSEAIRDEALPILYSGNQFDFSSLQALEDFASQFFFQVQSAHPVSVPIHGQISEQRHHSELESLAKPKIIELRLLGVYPRSANSRARPVWDSIKPTIAFANIYDKKSKSWLKIALPKTLQLQRLDVFRFAVDDALMFRIEENGTKERRTVGFAAEGSARFKEFVVRMLKDDAHKDRDEEKRERDVIAEMQRSRQYFQPTPATRALAFRKG